MYVLELVPVGICGLMPGLALADILHRVFCLRRAGDSGSAFEIFQKLLPQICIFAAEHAVISLL